MGRRISFQTNARHISQLGRELVTDFVTALVELVKNSYDADAEGVKIVFENIKSPAGRIIIVDSGTAMTQDDVEKKWAIIGTNNKIRSTHSAQGRKYAGKKGIGRFAVERLSERVTLYSFPEIEAPFKFLVNWNKYEDINIQALRQRISLLKYNPGDVESAKYIKSHLDYFLVNQFVKEEDKIVLSETILKNRNLEYTIFLNNKSIIEEIEKHVIPLLLKYQDEELRISDIYNETEELKQNEREEMKCFLRDFYKELGLEKESQTGLIIVLDGVRDEWKQKDILKLQKELRILVAPDFLQSNPFKVILEAPDFQLQSNIIMNDIISLYFAKIDAEIKDYSNKIIIQYTDKSGHNEKLEKDEFSLCGNVKMQLYYFIRDQEHLSTDVLNVRHARDILDEFCGIKIYRDGFHVKPYGDEGNDWLLLDQKKVKDTHSYLVGNNQVIGVINITEENNPLLIDATNREGIIENEAYEDLRKFVWECTSLISNIRYKEFLKKQEQNRIKEEEEKKKREDERRKKEEEERERLRKEKAEKESTKFNEIIENVKTNNINEAKKIVEEIQKSSEEYANFYKERLDEERKRNEDYFETTKQLFEETLLDKEKELSLYKNLATLGILTGSFGHETKDIISRITADIGYTKLRFTQEIFDDDLDGAYNQIFKDFGRIQGYSSLIVNYLKKEKREGKDKIIVKEAIEEVVALYDKMLVVQKIELLMSLNNLNDLETNILDIDLESIVINMVTNSFEALKPKKEKVLKIIGNVYENYYELIFEDSGTGIKLGEEERIFLPFTTSKKNGIGLGLCIVKDIVNRYNGSIHVNNSQIHGGAIFTIRFPRRV